MEKRAIIAFVLSFLVLLIYTMIFSPEREPTPPGGPKAPEGETVSEERQAKKAGRPETVTVQPPIVPTPVEKEKPDIPPPAVDQKTVIVETPLYKATLSNLGATLKSFKLKHYFQTTAPDAPMIELGTPDNQNAGLVSVIYDRPSGTMNQEILYRVDQEKLHMEIGSSPREIRFLGETPDGISVTQTYRFYPDKYQIDLTLTVLNGSGQKAEGSVKAQLKNIPPAEKTSYYAFIGAALFRNNELEEIEPDDLKEENKVLAGDIDWVAYEDEYFIRAVIPDDQRKGSFNARMTPERILQTEYISPPLGLSANEKSVSRFILFLGPRDLTVLKPLNKKLDRAIDFGWTDVIAKPLLYALRFFNKYVNNYGLSIVILTILIKILFWPLTHKSYKSMKEMQKIQPLMVKLREKYKDNKEQMNRELMSLYKTYKVNPMGGCLPMIIQIPVFFALFRILGNSIELRHAPFALWINDLSAPDRLFNFGFSIPFMSPPYGIPVLTLLMGASMLIQQKMTPTPGDPTQAKIMMFLPIVFTVMFINFPSGLVLYWLTNNILSIGQQYRILKKSA